MKKICSKLGKINRRVSEDVLVLFKKYDWPGNIRQLEYIIESALTLIRSNEPEILLEHLPEYFRITSVDNEINSIKESEDDDNVSLKDEINRMEKNRIILTLEQTNGNISKAAKKLNMSRQSLHYRMKKYKIKISKSKIF
ncbi:Transcriptional regulator containing GAF, AAA-type ATPase, and DNA binding domains [Maledivibacter halophilus]|uniref:Transcriptional regulator containing GAF, AAA-type ATPase, and DNA binding domains n=1 Tax=Maledivibacter halophilus TaxID=36842 RepID=A0A1T5IKF8_9FIRM|nr:helix-turn-helix domain-containing protein [Maledivibacter halophilus]SKC39694.1 Transcriptional regulator containing GAF, AAA-type ATPase, and DNA binding domains [Maledivibacter halophilus]